MGLDHWIQYYHCFKNLLMFTSVFLITETVIFSYIKDRNYCVTFCRSSVMTSIELLVENNLWWAVVSRSDSWGWESRPRWSSEHATYAQNSPTNIHKSSVAARDVVVGEMMENQFTGRSRRLHFLFLRVKNVFSVRDIVDRCCSEQCAINIFWSGRELHLSFQVSTCGFISLQQSFCSADEDCPTFGRTRCKGLSIGLCLTG